MCAHGWPKALGWGGRTNWDGGKTFVGILFTSWPPDMTGFDKRRNNKETISNCRVSEF